MNTEHDAFCSSPERAARLAEEVIPWGLVDLPLTGHVLELVRPAGWFAGTDSPPPMTCAIFTRATSTNRSIRKP